MPPDAKEGRKAALEQRRVRNLLGLPDPGAHSTVVPNLNRKSPLERKIIAQAAKKTAEFVQAELDTIEQQSLKVDADTSTSEVALDNTRHALLNINQVLRKYYYAEDAGLLDVKKDRLIVDAANQTLRTLARVHEAYLRGQNTDRLGQILSEIRKMETGEK
jgi:hypothetical protein